MPSSVVDHTAALTTTKPQPAPHQRGEGRNTTTASALALTTDAADQNDQRYSRIRSSRQAVPPIADTAHTQGADVSGRRKVANTNNATTARAVQNLSEHLLGGSTLSNPSVELEDTTNTTSRHHHQPANTNSAQEELYHYPSANSTSRGGAPASGSYTSPNLVPSSSSLVTTMEEATTATYGSSEAYTYAPAGEHRGSSVAGPAATTTTANNGKPSGRLAHQLVVVIRHGERADEHTPTAMLNPSLTTNGVGKIKSDLVPALLQELQTRYPFIDENYLKSEFVVVSSPFRRCVETATALIAAGVGSANAIPAAKVRQQSSPRGINWSMGSTAMMASTLNGSASSTSASPNRAGVAKRGSVASGATSDPSASSTTAAADNSPNTAADTPIITNASLLPLIDDRICEVFGPIRIKANVSNKPAADLLDEFRHPEGAYFANWSKDQGSKLYCRAGSNVLPAWGETLEASQRRYQKAMCELAFEVTDVPACPKNIILVSHGDMLNAIFGGLHPEQMLYAVDYLGFAVIKRRLPKPRSNGKRRDRIPASFSGRDFRMVGTNGLMWIDDGEATPPVDWAAIVDDDEEGEETAAATTTASAVGADRGGVNKRGGAATTNTAITASPAIAPPPQSAEISNAVGAAGGRDAMGGGGDESSDLRTVMSTNVASDLYSTSQAGSNMSPTSGVGTQHQQQPAAAAHLPTEQQHQLHVGVLPASVAQTTPPRDEANLSGGGGGGGLRHHQAIPDGHGNRSHDDADADETPLMVHYGSCGDIDTCSYELDDIEGDAGVSSGASQRRKQLRSRRPTAGCVVVIGVTYGSVAGMHLAGFGIASTAVNGEAATYAWAAGITGSVVIMAVLSRHFVPMIGGAMDAVERGVVGTICGLGSSGNDHHRSTARVSPAADGGTTDGGINPNNASTTSTVRDGYSRRQSAARAQNNGTTTIISGAPDMNSSLSRGNNTDARAPHHHNGSAGGSSRRASSSSGSNVAPSPTNKMLTVVARVTLRMAAYVGAVIGLDIAAVYIASRHVQPPNTRATRLWEAVTATAGPWVLFVVALLLWCFTEARLIPFARLLARRQRVRDSSGGGRVGEPAEYA